MKLNLCWSIVKPLWHQNRSYLWGDRINPQATWLLVGWCPGCRRRESSSGIYRHYRKQSLGWKGRNSRKWHSNITRRWAAESINNIARRSRKSQFWEIELFRSSRQIAWLWLWLSASRVYFLVPAPASDANCVALYCTWVRARSQICSTSAWFAISLA
jgi:hypothetical protein